MTEWKNKIDPDLNKVKGFTDKLQSLVDMLQSLANKNIEEMSKAQMELERLEAQKKMTKKVSDKNG